MTAFAQGELVAAFTDWTVDHRDNTGAFIESLALPDNQVRAIYQFSFDADGNLWACDCHGPQPVTPLPYPSGETDWDIEGLGGGRILKWKRDGSRDAAWALTPAGRYGTDPSNLWPGSATPDGHGELNAPYTCFPMSTGLLVGEAADFEATFSTARLRVIDYTTGEVIRTYPHFDELAADFDAANLHWVTADEEAQIIYFIGGNSVRKYDIATDTVSTQPFIDMPAGPGVGVTGVRQNILGQLVVYIPGDSLGAGFEHGLFFIIEKSDGSTVYSLNLNNTMLADTATMHERIIQPGGWGCDIDNPTQVWFSARQFHPTTGAIAGTRIYHADISIAGSLSHLGHVDTGTTRWAIGLPDGSFRTAYPGLARYRPDGSRVWLRSSFS